MVTTDKPMFVMADGAGAPPIRAGVWRTELPDCPFDETLTQDKWPKCSQAAGGIGDPPIWLEVAGDPPLLQVPMTLPYNKGEPPMYVYLAFRPLKLDDKGRVVAMKQWPVRCGPPPPTEDVQSPAPPTPPPLPPSPEPSQGLYSPSDPLSLTRLSGGSDAAAPSGIDKAQEAQLDASLEQLKVSMAKLAKVMARMTPSKSPLPGLKMNDQGGCTPESVAALRNAAKASEAWADDNPMSHWVRTPKQGDMPAVSPTSIMDMKPPG